MATNVCNAPLLLVLIAVLLATACSKPQISSGPQEPESPPVTVTRPVGCELVEPVTQWLSSRALPLKGVTAGLGFADLEKLKPALEGVRVVGLGEATHGSREG